MKCKFCDNPATVHLMDVVHKKKREAHLCERCARERNLLPDPPGPQIDLKALLNLMPTLQAQAGVGVAPTTEPTCPECGLTYASFKNEGRLGCGHDYEVFRPILESLLERVQRATTHEGKFPAAARRAAELDDLQTRMKAAVSVEDYEQAARLRDLIRQKEAEGTTG